ncbi:MAG: hypothetical protein KIS85_01930 [Anaerolineales bacterium]|nr:hypothetical protein [Anaerolineales bacterium]
MKHIHLPTPSSLQRMLHRALRAWHKARFAPQPAFLELLYFRPPAGSPPLPGVEQSRRAYAQLEEAIGQFSHQPRHAEVLLRRFRDDENTRRIAFDWHCSPDHVNRVQREAIQSLALWLHSQEEVLRSREIHRQLARLPASTYSVLVGRERLVAQLVGLLERADGPGVVALTGLGGLGKTALADAAVRQIAQGRAFDEILWLRAEPGQSWNWPLLKERLARELLPGWLPGSEFDADLLRTLKGQPHLVVLDNLETEAAEEWLGELQALCHPSKFLLTHRRLPGALQDVHVVKITELSQAEAGQFLLGQLYLLGLSEAADDAQAQLAQIFEHTGGNPLALKLVAGLLRSLSLESILGALQRGSSSSADQLYASIYQAAWTTLPPPARRLLLAFTLVGEEGASLQQLEAIDGLRARQRHDALEQLTGLSLLELRRAGSEPRYGVHRLTQTFLAAQLQGLPAKQRLAQRLRLAANLGYWSEALQAGEIAASDGGNLAQALRLGLAQPDMWPACASLLRKLHPQLRGKGTAARWEATYQQAIQHPAAQGPAVADLHNQLGALAWQLEDHPRALAAFEEAERLAAPGSQAQYTAVIGICLCLWSLGEAGQAHKVGRAALKKAPHEPRLQALNALLCYARGKYAAGEKHFRRAIRLLAPEQSEMAVQLHMQRGANLQMDGKFLPALKQYALAAHHLGPQRQTSREAAHLELIRSSAFFQLGDLQNADACLRRAARYAPLSEEAASRAYFESSLGRLALQLGARQDAERYLKSAARLWKKAGKPHITINAIQFLQSAERG